MRTGSETQFSWYLQGIEVPFFPFFFVGGGNIFSRIFIFKVLLPKVGRVFSSNILKLFFRHTVHIGMLVRTAVGWTGN